MSIVSVRGLYDDQCGPGRFALQVEVAERDDLCTKVFELFPFEQRFGIRQLILTQVRSKKG